MHPAVQREGAQPSGIPVSKICRLLEKNTGFGWLP